jgi:hypothetical protein
LPYNVLFDENGNMRWDIDLNNMNREYNDEEMAEFYK